MADNDMICDEGTSTIIGLQYNWIDRRRGIG